MNYEFSLDKKTGLLVVGCCVLAAILLLTAGFLIGISTPSGRHVAATSQSLATPATQLSATNTAQPAQPESNSANAQPAAATAMPAAAPTFCIQFGSFLNQANAGALVKQLKKAGITATLSPFEDDAAKTWYVVRSGSYSSMDDAAQAAQGLRKQLGLSALVRRSGIL